MIQPSSTPGAIKNRAVVTFVAFLIGVGIAWLYVVSTRQPGKEAATEQIVQGSQSVSPLAARLSSDSMALLAIKPANFESATQTLGLLSARITSTALWKKLEGQKLLESLLEAQTQAVSASPALSSTSFQDTFQLLRQLWSSITDISVVLNKKGFALTPSLKAPSALIDISFKSEQFPKKAWDTAASHSRTSKDLLLAEGIEIRSVDEATRSITFTLRKVDSLVVPSVLKVGDNNIQLAFGTENTTDFMSAEGSIPLTGSPSWTQSLSAYTPKPGVYVYADLAAFVPFISHIVADLQSALKNSPSAGSSAQNLAGENSPLLSGLKEMQSLGGSYSIDNALTGRQCITYTTDSKTLQILSRQARSSTARLPESLLNLVTGQTLASVKLSKSVILTWLEEIRLNYEQVSSTGTDLTGQTPEWRKFNENLSKAISEFGSLPFDEAGLIVNQSAFGPIPEIVGYLGSAGRTDPESLAIAINKIALTLAPENKEPIAELREQTGGGKEIELSLDGQSSAWLVPVTEHTVIVATNKQSIQPLAQLISGSPKVPWVTPERLIASGISTPPDNMDLFVYLSTRSALELARPLLPILLMQRPDLDISNPDIDELIKTISADLFISGKISLQEPRTICTEGKAAILN